MVIDFSALGKVEFGKTFLEIFPRGKTDFSRAAFRDRLIGTEKNMTLNIIDAEVAGDFLHFFIGGHGWSLVYWGVGRIQDSNF